MTPQKIDSQKRSFFQDRKMWFWMAAGAGLLTLIISLIFLQSLISTTKYYVLNQDVPARTLITADMLEEQVVSSGGQPPTALTLEEIQYDEFYSKADLEMGDILTASNTGPLMPLQQGLPDDFVVTSFSADPNSSAGGNVGRGDYIDIFYVGDGQATLLFQRVLVLETTQDLNGSGNVTEENAATGADTSAVEAFRGGIPFLYTVGLSQDDALKLSAASNGTFYVVLTSPKDVKDGATPKTSGMDLNDVLSSEARDSGAGTDSSFGKKKDTDENKESTDENKSSEENSGSTEEPTSILEEESELSGSE